MIKLNKNQSLITAIKNCGSDENKIFELIQSAYNAGYNKALDNIFSPPKK